MLYDFHRYQNKQRANSIHATYLVYGTMADSAQENGDVEMTSSMPEHEPLSETVPSTTLTLVAEENLQGTALFV
jgi:DNA polymerase delta subunit 3